MKTKKGITMTSLSIYVVLLFSMITLALLVSNNVNDRMFDERGLVINITNADKLQYNMLNSGNESTSVSALENKVAFSNGDTYSYDSEKRVIYKNETALVDNVEECVITSENNTFGKTYVKMSIKFNKYLNELQRDISVCVEE